MDNNFRNWAIEKVKKETSDTDKRQKFLRVLKFQPDKILSFLSSAIYDWGLWCTVQTEKIVVVNFNEDPPELLKALQEHFAEEMVGIV